MLAYIFISMYVYLMYISTTWIFSRLLPFQNTWIINSCHKWWIIINIVYDINTHIYNYFKQNSNLKVLSRAPMRANISFRAKDCYITLRIKKTVCKKYSLQSRQGQTRHRKPSNQTSPYTYFDKDSKPSLSRY